ncbi:Ca2+-dependent lipid-binding protein [Flavobacterium sp. 2755]|uniref:hypothetical protein n=1 Tax=Flavobacterium sp. 2755 TaxID=2817765 RepID=UPI00286386DA|nr:hypothetical protein [Flavobacterium sp. 2755]MDR6762677.1 Ca2+-dependent lipid-binding protein [Flavobacterium sp. 2755]
MTLKFKINDNYDDELFLSHLQHHLIKQEISDVSIINNKIVLKNNLFNGQSQMNSFAYTAEGFFYIRHFETYKTLYYTYYNFRILLYIGSLFLVLGFFFETFRILTIAVILITLINQTLYRKKQKRFITKKISEFATANQA